MARCLQHTCAQVVQGGPGVGHTQYLLFDKMLNILNAEYQFQKYYRGLKLVQRQSLSKLNRTASTEVLLVIRRNWKKKKLTKQEHIVHSFIGQANSCKRIKIHTRPFRNIQDHTGP